MKAIIVLLSLLCAVAGREIKLGIQIPFSGSWPGGPKMASSLLIAIDKVNNDTSLLPGHNLTWTMHDDQCSARYSLAALVDDYTLSPPPIDVSIGPGCSVGCLPGGHLSAHWNLPMISWGCTASVLSDKAIFPTFSRTGSSYSGIGLYVKALMQHYKWDRMNLICSTQAIWSQICQTFKIQIETNTSMTVPYFGSFDPHSTEDYKMASMLSAAGKKARSKS